MGASKKYRNIDYTKNPEYAATYSGQISTIQKSESNYKLNHSGKLNT